MFSQIGTTTPGVRYVFGVRSGLDLLTDWIVGKPLTEAQVLAICHSPTSDLVGDHRLTLRRIAARGKRKPLHQIFGETPPIPATPGFGKFKFPILRIKRPLISMNSVPRRRGPSALAQIRPNILHRPG